MTSVVLVLLVYPIDSLSSRRREPLGSHHPATMRYSLSRLLAALLPLLSVAVSVPVGPVRVPRHATIVDGQSVSSNYTFIIAGGGIAGLTLADRLTEDPNGME